MKVDLAALHASVNRLFPFLLSLCKKTEENAEAPLHF